MAELTRGRESSRGLVVSRELEVDDLEVKMGTFLAGIVVVGLGDE